MINPDGFTHHTNAIRLMFRIEVDYAQIVRHIQNSNGAVPAAIRSVPGAITSVEIPIARLAISLIRDGRFRVVGTGAFCKNTKTMQTIQFIPRDEIERSASNVLAAVGITHAPVDPVQIAASDGIEVFSIEFADDSICGILRVEDGKHCIYVNQDHHRLRMRYTIAHELGRYFLHRQHVPAFVDEELNLYRSKSSDESGEADRMEVQANMFAAALLMPESHLRDAYEKIQDVTHLAKLFAVSRAAMGHRIVNLGL